MQLPVGQQRHALGQRHALSREPLRFDSNAQRMALQAHGTGRAFSLPCASRAFREGSQTERSLPTDGSGKWPSRVGRFRAKPPDPAIGRVCEEPWADAGEVLRHRAEGWSSHGAPPESGGGAVAAITCVGHARPVWMSGGASGQRKRKNGDGSVLADSLSDLVLVDVGGPSPAGLLCLELPPVKLMLALPWSWGASYHRRGAEGS